MTFQPRLSMCAVTVRVALTVLTIVAYATYANEAPQRVKPAPGAAAIILVGVLIPYTASWVMEISKSQLPAVLFEGFHLFCGFVIALQLVVCVVCFRTDKMIPAWVGDVYLVFFLWMAQSAFAFLALLSWAWYERW